MLTLEQIQKRLESFDGFVVIDNEDIPYGVLIDAIIEDSKLFLIVENEMDVFEIPFNGVIDHIIVVSDKDKLKPGNYLKVY